MALAEATSTLTLALKRNGFEYMLNWFYDDQPTWFRTDYGPILAVPYPSMELSDLPGYVNRKTSDSDFATMLVDCFNEQLEESSLCPQLYAVSLLTFLTGQPHRIRQLRRVLNHIADRRDRIWLTIPGQITTYVASLSKDIVELS